MNDCVEPFAKPPAVKEWSASTRWQLLGLTFALTGLTPLAEWLWWRESFVHHVGVFISLVLMFVPMGLFIALMASLLGLCFNHHRRNALCLLLCSLTAIPCYCFGLVLSHPIKRTALNQVMVRAEPLIAAIRKYEAASGLSPADLGVLVPGYLAAVPTPGIGTSSEFYYRRASPDDGSEGNPWMLIVRPPVIGMGFDRFFYLPNQNYPERGWGGVLERIGNWAYYHE